LNEAEQAEYLSLLGRGASPAVACRQLLVELDELAITLEEFPRFAARVRRVTELLSQNVAAALYRSALEGNVTAQSCYLRHVTPPEWLNAAHADDSLAKLQLELSSLADEELELRQQQLVDQCSATTTAVPDATASRVDPPPTAAASPELSRGDSTD